MDATGETIARRTVIAAIAVFVILLTIVLWQSFEATRRTAGRDQIEQDWIDAYALARAIETLPESGSADFASVASPLGINAAFAIYAQGSGAVATWIPTGKEALAVDFPTSAPEIESQARIWPISIPAKTERTRLLAIRLADGRILVVAHAGRAETPWIRTLAAYQAMTLLVAIAALVVLLRRIGQGLRTRLDLPEGSPSHNPDGAQRETEFVVETFQSVIGELQHKGRELELLSQRQRERAERSERFSERVIDQMPAGLVVVARNGLITAANRSARDLFADLPGARMEETDYIRAFHEAPDLIHIVGECLQQGATFQRREVEMRTTRGASKGKCLGVSVSPISPPRGEPEAALCLMADLTEIVDLRERVRLQENLANLGEMAAGLAHELKNSLATIQGYAQLIAHLAPVSAGEPSEALVAEVRELTQMVTDFLNFARPQDLSMVQIPVADIVETAMARFEAKIAEAKVTVEIRNDAPDRAVAVSADEMLLGRAIANLIQNAIDALESVDSDRRIVVHISQPGPLEVVVEVRDSGPGIPPSDLSKIFIPFFTTRSRGYGIGLALTQKILLSHGGRITAENGDPGAVFRCTLPVLNHP